MALRARAAKEKEARQGEAVREPRVSVRPERLDRVVHDRTRLAILAALATADALSFTDLKALTNTTDGNLSVHARRLEEAGYVVCEKTFAGRTPRTEYRLNATGRAAFKKYLDHMDALIKAARKR